MRNVQFGCSFWKRAALCIALLIFVRPFALLRNHRLLFTERKSKLSRCRVSQPFRYSARSSPASVSVITSEDFEQKQIERVSDALREVPGLSVVKPGQRPIDVVFTRGLRSEHTQVLLDGVPINQGCRARLISPI
jgi:outer membrane receptor for ferrienterochelin and colicin